MDNMEYIKGEIEKLYKTNPNVHISLSRTHPKIVIEAAPVKIVGVYNNIFQVEECEGGKLPARHTIQYSEVLIGQVVISELNYTKPTSILTKK